MDIKAKKISQLTKLDIEAEKQRYLNSYLLIAYNNGVDILNAIQGESLYSTTSGSAGSIQLSNSAANYDKLYIEFIDNDGTVGSKEITSPNGKNIYLSITYPGSVAYKKDVIVAISSTSITPQTYSTITFRNNQSPTINSSTNYIYITKVIGFKY